MSNQGKGFGTQKPSRENYLAFLKKVFKAITENDNIEKLLKENINLLNEELPKYLLPCFSFYIEQCWSKELLIEVIQNFASYIGNFPNGNQSLNIELAIQFIKFDLKLIDCDIEPEIGIKLQLESRLRCYHLNLSSVILRGAQDA